MSTSELHWGLLNVYQEITGSQIFFLIYRQPEWKKKNSYIHLLEKPAFYLVQFSCFHDFSIFLRFAINRTNWYCIPWFSQITGCLSFKFICPHLNIKKDFFACKTIIKTCFAEVTQMLMAKSYWMQAFCTGNAPILALKKYTDLSFFKKTFVHSHCQYLC